jgi:hypothetical protein
MESTVVSSELLQRGAERLKQGINPAFRRVLLGPPTAYRDHEGCTAGVTSSSDITASSLLRKKQLTVSVLCFSLLEEP